MARWKKGDSVPRKPIAEVGYEALSHYEWDDQVAERERRFRPRVEALGSAGTETLDEMIVSLAEYQRRLTKASSSETAALYREARASFNALCHFMGIEVGSWKYEPHNPAERGQFWEWCWERANMHRLQNARQMAMRVDVES